MLEIEFHPSLRKLRQFGVISTLCFMALSVILLLKKAPSGLDLLCGFLAVYSLAGVLFTPRILRPLFVGLSVLAYPIGWVVSHLILIIVFFGVFFPIGIILRLLGKDPLVKGTVKTNWEKVGRTREPKNYLEQY